MKENSGLKWLSCYNRRVVCMLTMLFLLISNIQAKAQSADFGLKVSALGYCVMDADTKELILSHNADQQYAPASITKIMTLLITAENITDLQQTVVMSDGALNALTPMSSTLSPIARPGESFTVQDLCYGLIMRSGNECANALAETVAGGTEAFAVLMNEKAAALGAYNTHFVNAHGLDADGHMTTPHDMALIMQAALQNEFCRTVLSMPQYTIPASVYSEARMMGAGHRMVSGEVTCAGVFAGKPGYTWNAQATLVTAAARSGRTLIVVVMHSEEGQSYEDTALLLNSAEQILAGQTPTGGALVYNPQVSEVSAVGFTVTWTVGPEAVRAVFPVWMEGVAEDTMTMDEAGVSGDTISYQVDLSRHVQSKGVYTVQAYVYDVLGAQHISTVKVYAGSDNQTTGFFTQDGAVYYRKENGSLALNWLELPEGAYYFDYGTAQMATGWYGSGHDRMYLDAAGKLVNGWQTIDGKLYYFFVPGDMAWGTMIIDGQTCIFDDTGVLIHAMPGPRAAELIRKQIND